MVPRSDRVASSVVTLGVVSVLAVTTAVAIFLLVFQRTLSETPNLAIFATFWWLPPLAVFITGIHGLASSRAIRDMRYSAIAKRNLSFGLSQAGSSVIFGLVGFTSVGLMFAAAFSRAVATLGLIGRPRTERLSFRRHVWVARKYRRFPLVGTGARFLNVAGTQVPILIVIAAFGPVEAGLFALTIRVLAAPIGIVADAAAQSFEGSFSSALRDRSTKLQTIVLRYVAKLSIVAAPAVTLIMLFGPQAFAFIFGEQWRGAGEIAQIVAVTYGVQLVASPISRALFVLERQFLQLVWDALRLLSTVGAVLILISLDGGLSGTLFALSIAQTASYLILIVFCLGAARNGSIR